MTRYIAMLAIVMALTLPYALRVRRPPHARYLRNPREVALVGFWNMFSTRKWTPEGLAYHRHILRTTGLFAVLSFIGIAVLLALASQRPESSASRPTPSGTSEDSAGHQPR